MGASSNTTFAALPPSSRVSRLSVPATARMIALPTSVEPVNATLSTPGCSTEQASGVARAGEDVHDAGREVCLAADVGEGQGGERRRLGGLEHDGVAARQRRSDLPGEHQQREVPGDDLRGDADRPGVAPVAGMVQLVGPACVVEEVGSDQRKVDVARLADGLAVVQRLEDGQLARPLLDQARDPEEVLAPVSAAHRPPGALVGVARGPHRPVDVLAAGLGDLREDLLRRRVDRLEGRAPDGVGELAVDEQAVRRGDVDDAARLRRGCVLEGHGSSTQSIVT